MTAQQTLVITTEAGQFPCAEGDTLLRAALRAGVGASYECNSGGCGTCKFTPRSGSFAQVQEDPGGLTPRDRRRGRELACQSVPLEDCDVELTLDAAPSAAPAPATRAGTVVARRELTHDLTELTVTVDGPADFLPGQFAMLRLIDGVAPGAVERLRSERAYSMSNLANDRGEWQFQVKEVPGGAVSRLLSKTVEVGTRVSVDGPYGHAYLKDTGRDVVCIAGGSGLAPMVSVARGLAARADADDRSLHFFYGGRRVRDLCAGEFVEEVSGALRATTLVEALSDAEPDTWAGPTGFVHEAVQQASLVDLTDRDIYIAGPPVMTDAVVRLLMLELDVSADQVHYDRFF
ncbi:2Fe-2S iron-sulfur cluster-binding protein [Oryzobacter terrae]|uniref:2Fe-2S iron-sulfur cluster-binding protein n=1 Tax=Oryzobacter terrae TaxID=1620385 RepID=UPI0036725AC2